MWYVAGPSSFPGSSPSLLFMDSKNMALLTCPCQSSFLLAVTTSDQCTASGMPKCSTAGPVAIPLVTI